MKRYFSFVLLMLSFGTFLLACSQGASIEGNNLEAVGPDIALDTAIYTKIELYNDTTWDAIEQQWMVEHFNPCLKEAKVKISCGDCIGIYLDVNFFIDKYGKLEKYEINRSRFCGKERLKDCLLEHFENLDFPEKYHETIFQARLGRLLKC